MTQEGPSGPRLASSTPLLSTSQGSGCRSGFGLTAPPGIAPCRRLPSFSLFWPRLVLLKFVRMKLHLHFLSAVMSSRPITSPGHQGVPTNVVCLRDAQVSPDWGVLVSAP